LRAARSLKLRVGEKETLHLVYWHDSIRSLSLFMIEQFLILLGALALVFGLRGILLLRHRWVGVDTFYHLSEARSIRERSTEQFRQRFFLAEDYEYPPLLHYLLSRLGDGRRLQFLGPMADMANTVLLALLLTVLDSPSLVAVGLVLYAFTPYFLEASSSVSPRPFANLFLSGSMLSLLSFFLYHDWSFVFLSMLLAGLVFLTNRLTSQSLLVVLVVLAVTFISWAPVLVLGGGLLVSVALTRGKYLRVVKAHFETLRTRARVGDDYGRHLIDPVQALFNFPLLIFAPLAFVYGDALRGVGFTFVTAWSFSVIALAIVWPFGEGFRHLMNAWTPFVVLLASWSIGNLAVLVVLIAVASSLSLVKLVRMSRNVTFIVPERLSEAGHYLDEHAQPEDLILCVPKEISYALLYFTRRARVLAGSGGDPRGAEFNVAVLRRYERRGEYEKLVEIYPVEWVVDITGHDWGDKASLEFRSDSVSTWRIRR